MAALAGNTSRETNTDSALISNGNTVKFVSLTSKQIIERALFSKQ